MSDLLSVGLLSPREQLPTIACVNRASVQMGICWTRLLATLDEYVNEVLAPIWGTRARIIDGMRRYTLPAGCWQLVFFDTTDRPGNLGYHDLTPDGRPLAKVFVQDVLQHGGYVSAAASHEVAEMLIDPGIQSVVPGPGGDTLFAYEISDAVETDVFLIDRVPVSNFVYPSWFGGAPQGSLLCSSSHGFDHLKRCSGPFDIRPDGFMLVLVNGTITTVWGTNGPIASISSSSRPRIAMRGMRLRRRSEFHTTQI